MSTVVWEQPAIPPSIPGTPPQWYAVQTRARHERMVATRLQEHGVTTFLPTVNEVRRWSDRQKLVEFPLFSCYTFVNFAWLPEVRSRILGTNGVLGFVGFCGGPVPIADVEIESIRKMLANNVPYTAYPFLRIGQRVRIRGGALEDLEGVLVARKGKKTLIVSIEAIQRSLAICIDGYRVEAL